MRKPRTAHLWRMSLTFLALIFLALGSFWLLQLLNRDNLSIQADQQRDEPDYFVDHFSVVKMSPAGQPSYIVSGTKLTHHPLDDSSDIDKPFLRNLAPGRPPTDVHADRGRVDQDHTRVVLTGNVIVDRPAAPGFQNLNLKSESLTVFPDSERMETDRPVAMYAGTTLVTGVGMVANNATGQVDIAHRLRITYPPAPR